jgi:Xaa-Pro aminopeptidase
VLHYNIDNRVMRSGELVVMDVGASYHGYAGDVTRTVPVDGHYTEAQRAVYGIVRDAQAAAERQATLGAPARRMSDSATAVLAAGLARLGLIEADTATYECGSDRRCAQWSLYYMHLLGHGIGLEVHDPEQFYFTGRIEAGSAFTIEPGLYVRQQLGAIVPDTPRNRAMLAKIGPAIARYANIGVRIEDDYIATSAGVRRISNAPREVDEIEAMMRRFRDRR